MFSPNDYEKNDKIILKYFQWLKIWKNCIVLIATSIEGLENLKYHTFKEKTLVLSVIYSKCKMKMKKYLKNKIQLRSCEFLV